jgi:hypothetical protein
MTRYRRYTLRGFARLRRLIADAPIAESPKAAKAVESDNPENEIGKPAPNALEEETA